MKERDRVIMDKMDQAAVDLTDSAKKITIGVGLGSLIAGGICLYFGITAANSVLTFFGILFLVAAVGSAILYYLGSKVKNAKDTVVQGYKEAAAA